MTYAVIRVRGSVNVREDIKDTLKMLRLNRVNHLVFLPENDSYAGMLQKVKDYVTWGEIKPETLAKIIIRRGSRRFFMKGIPGNFKYNNTIRDRAVYCFE